MSELRVLLAAIAMGIAGRGCAPRSRTSAERPIRETEAVGRWMMDALVDAALREAK